MPFDPQRLVFGGQNSKKMIFRKNCYFSLGILWLQWPYFNIHLFPAKYRQSARISVIVHRFRQYGIEHLLLDTEHKVRYSAA